MEALQKMGRMDRDNLSSIIKDPDTQMFDLIYANIVANAAKGEKDARQVMMERLWGKPKETELTLPHQELLSRIPLADLVELARKAKEEPKGDINGSDQKN